MGSKSDPRLGSGRGLGGVGVDERVDFDSGVGGITSICLSSKG